MDFTIERTDFPSEVHRHIYSSARELTPLSRSLDGVVDPDMRASCEAFHAFVLDWLSDMYENPEEYGVKAGALERFLGGRKVNGAKQQQPSKTKSLEAETRNAVSKYQAMLCMIGQMGTIDGDRVRLSEEDMQSIAKSTSSSVSPIPIHVRLNGFARVGLVWRDGAFTQERYPGMFLSMCALAKRADRLSSFDYFAFTNLEFRNLTGKYKPVFQDYINPLTSDKQKIAVEIDGIARSMSLKPNCNTFWKVDYKYKGTQALCIEYYLGDLIIRVVETYGWDDAALINDRLLRESEALQQYALRHVWGCTACSTSHLGRFANILGKKRRVCMGGGIGFRVTNPAAEDIGYISALMKLRCEIIDEIGEDATSTPESV